MAWKYHNNNNSSKAWKVGFVLWVLSSLEICRGHPQVPGYFILGDSLSDCGNNNGLLTVAKANYKPFGIDFPDGPTGRFSNGRTIVDVITELLGFDGYIPPFLLSLGKGVLKGVNYASAGGGIRPETGQQLGQTISLSAQLKNYQITFAQISNILGGDAAARNYVNKCLFTVGIGSNDYINNFFMPNIYPTSKLYSTDQYAAELITQYSKNLDTLYKYGARKVALLGLGPIGCSPAELAKYAASPGSTCVDDINGAIEIFNQRLVALVDTLNNNYKDAKFTYINIYGMGNENLKVAGFKVLDSGCCGGQKGCLPLATPCKNRKEYAFWDEYHPTDAVNYIYGNRAYKAMIPTDVHPFDISALIQ